MAKATWKAQCWRKAPRPWQWKATSIFRRTLSARNISGPALSTVWCPWKGTASYYDVEVDGKRNAGAAWFYPEPKPAAKQIKGYVAFWKGVRVEK
jgi:Domain of unknown function (DUF427)